jgi:hypothetical protein
MQPRLPTDGDIGDDAQHRMQVFERIELFQLVSVTGGDD